MANPNHLRQPRLGANRAKIGIGRAATQEWVSELAETFASKAPSGVRLQLRRTPAVNYVNAEELAALCPNRTQSTLTGGIDRLLHNLVSTDRLGESALSDTIRTSTKVRDIFPKLQGYRLQMQVYDTPDETNLYPCGYVVRGEKAVVRETFDLDYNFKALDQKSPTPIHILKLGVISDEFGVLSPEAIKDLQHALPGAPVLGSVGVISL